MVKEKNYILAIDVLQNEIDNMKQIKPFNNCPLCQSFKRSKSFISYKNRYSEEIAEDLNINENELLNLLSNVKCNNCGLVYKKNWFTKNYLEKL